jgi:hypothetical protein
LGGVKYRVEFGLKGMAVDPNGEVKREALARGTPVEIRFDTTQKRAA